METKLDASVYPDEEAPRQLADDAQKADYLHRVVAALDYGLAPDEATLDLLAGWKEVFDRFPLNASPAYHALREFFGWERVERLPYHTDPAYLTFDRIEGRDDGFEDSL